MPTPGASTTTVNRIVRRTYAGSGWRDKPVEAWHATDLAIYFAEQVTFSVWQGSGPGGTNVPALRGQFARWRGSDGMGPLLVKTMIDQFLGNPKAISFGSAAWKSFVNQRQRWYDSAMKVLSEQEREDRSNDAAFWLGDGPIVETEIDWTGEKS